MVLLICNASFFLQLLDLLPFFWNHNDAITPNWISLSEENYNTDRSHVGLEKQFSVIDGTGFVRKMILRGTKCGMTLPILENLLSTILYE